MRKIVTDFDWTILLPMMLFTFVVLACFIHQYRLAKAEGNDIEARNVRNLLIFTIGALVVICAVFFAPSKLKVFFAFQIWGLLFFVSIVSVLIAALFTWDFVTKWEFVKAGLCLVAMLMGAASTEHCYHQKNNSHHVVCPDCNDDDERPDEDSRMLWRENPIAPTMKSARASSDGNERNGLHSQYRQNPSQ